MQKGGIQSINSSGVRGGFSVLRQNRGMGKYFCHPTVGYCLDLNRNTFWPGTSNVTQYKDADHICTVY